VEEFLYEFLVFISYYFPKSINLLPAPLLQEFSLFSVSLPTFGIRLFHSDACENISFSFA
jgi:hypothetical protein